MVTQYFTDGIRHLKIQDTMRCKMVVTLAPELKGVHSIDRFRVPSREPSTDVK